MGRICLAFVTPDGGVSIIRPNMRMRLVKTPDGPQPLDWVDRKIDPAAEGIAYAETEEEFRARVLSENIRVGKQVCRGGKRHEPGSFPTEADAIIEVDEDHIPVDLTFREAWVLKDAKPTVDMQRARDVQRARLREQRAPLLAGLDVEWSRAMAKGDARAAQEIETKRQTLRDVTTDPAIDAAQTPAALKAIRAQDRLSK